LIITEKSPTKGIYLGAAAAVESLLGLSATGSASYVLYKYILNNDPYDSASNKTDYDYFNPIARIVETGGSNSSNSTTKVYNGTNDTNTSSQN
jgi:hypothetical protein